MARLTKPFKTANKFNISQGFHDNHQALDLYSKYGTPLVAPEDSKVLEEICDCRISSGPEGIERGFGLHLKGLETGYYYTLWHMGHYPPVEPGELVRRGQILGFMSNSGNVSAGGHYVPLALRNQPPYPGTHVHIAMHLPNGQQIDPEPFIDWETEPTYGTSELVVAYMRWLKEVSLKYFK